jgi:hypothetical protein
MVKIKSLFTLLVIAGFFYGAYYMFNQWKASQDIKIDSSKKTQWEDVAISSGSFSPSSDVTEENLDNIVELPAWKYYRNGNFGISMNIPQKILGKDFCLNSKFEVPVKMIEYINTKTIFMVPEYFYENYTPSAEELRDKSGDITFEEDDPVDEGDPNLSDTNGDGINDCRKRYYSLSLIAEEIAGSTSVYNIAPLGNPKLGISMHTAVVSDTAELNKLIKDVFGDGCVLSKKTAVEGKEGLYKLEIANSGGKDKRGRDLKCNTNKVTDILYNPSRNKIAYALFPESGMFFSNDGGIYDKDIIASINLE